MRGPKRGDVSGKGEGGVSKREGVFFAGRTTMVLNWIRESK